MARAQQLPARSAPVRHAACQRCRRGRVVDLRSQHALVQRASMMRREPCSGPPVDRASARWPIDPRLPAGGCGAGSPALPLACAHGAGRRPAPHCMRIKSDNPAAQRAAVRPVDPRQLCCRRRRRAAARPPASGLGGARLSRFASLAISGVVAGLDQSQGSLGNHSRSMQTGRAQPSRHAGAPGRGHHAHQSTCLRPDSTAPGRARQAGPRRRPLLLDERRGQQQPWRRRRGSCCNSSTIGAAGPSLRAGPHERGACAPASPCRHPVPAAPSQDEGDPGRWAPSGGEVRHHALQQLSQPLAAAPGRSGARGQRDGAPGRPPQARAGATARRRPGRVPLPRCLPCPALLCPLWPRCHRFMAFDRHKNLVLGDAEEFRKLPPKKGIAEEDVRPPLPLAACWVSLGGCEAAECWAHVLAAPHGCCPS